ncbi:hypothetical protein [Variovorax sp.]|jgi:CRP/FNR family cyclic AMP-dependent transcriptional regulator|uniref:hypothetical protein n=1 Tax=Variovorax sp. TaxID=1871043 RepID=UPI003442DA7C
MPQHRQHSLREPLLAREEREAISSARWFSSLSPTLQHDILSSAQVFRHEHGEQIAVHGAAPMHWIACAKGTVRISSTSVHGGKSISA